MILPAIFWGYWLAYRSVGFCAINSHSAACGITGTGQIERRDGNEEQHGDRQHHGGRRLGEAKGVRVGIPPGARAEHGEEQAADPATLTAAPICSADVSTPAATPA